MSSALVVAIAALFGGAGCSAFHHGKSGSCQEGRLVELSLPEDVAAFAGCERATGIRIRTGATIDVSPLTDLEEITGDLTIGPTVGVDSVAFNGLVRVGGTIHVSSNGSLRGLFLPRLEQAGRIEVENNAVLSTISMPRLATVSGSLVITDNNVLELVTTTSLTTIGHELVIADQPMLNLLEMPRIAHMEALRLERDPLIPQDVVALITSKADVKTTLPPPPPSPTDAGVDGVLGDASTDARP
jgi:hypothetical protein